MDALALLTLLSRLRSGCVVNYSDEWWLSQQVGMECPRMTVREINARNGHLRALCRGIDDRIATGDGEVDCVKLEELLRLLAAHIVADNRRLVTMREKLGIDNEALTMERADDQERRFDELIEATFR